MREYGGVAALDAVLLVAGFGVLRGAGLVGSLRDGLRLAGLALVLSWALAGALGSFLLMAGPSFDGPQIVLACLALGVAGGVGHLGLLAAEGSLARP